MPSFNPGVVDVTFLLNSYHIPPGTATRPPGTVTGFSSQRFEYFKLAILDIVNELPLSRDGIRVGVLQFTDTTAEESIRLGSNSDTFNLALDALTETSIAGSSDPSHSDVILDAIEDLSPDGEFGVRSYSLRILFILTDDLTSSSAVDIVNAVNQAEDEGIIVLGIVPPPTDDLFWFRLVSANTDGLIAQGAQEVASAAYEFAFLQCGKYKPI